MAEQVQVDLQAELARLRAENEALKASASKPRALSLKVSEKGAVSVYGINTRFPLTLYKEQMVRLLDHADVIRAFIKANEGKFSSKPPKTQA